MLKKKPKMRNEAFFQIFVIGSIVIEGALAPWATSLATPMILRQDRTLKFFHKKTFKAKLE